MLDVGIPQQLVVVYADSVISRQRVAEEFLNGEKNK